MAIIQGTVESAVLPEPDYSHNSLGDYTVPKITVNDPQATSATYTFQHVGNVKNTSTTGHSQTVQISTSNYSANVQSVVVDIADTGSDTVILSAGQAAKVNFTITVAVPPAVSFGSPRTVDSYSFDIDESWTH